MVQIDIKKPSMCRLTDEEGRIHKCPFLNGEYECILQGCISYWTWERQYKNCPLHEVTDTDTISRQAAIDEIKNADVVVLYYDGEPIDEAIERAIKAVKRSVVASVENLSSAQPERKGWIHIDDIYRLIVGHSDYHGDNILAALTCLAEGKEVRNPITVLDTEPEKSNAKEEKSTSDCITRQDAIDMAKRLLGDSEISRTMQTALYILPPAQPEDICSECDAWNVYKNYAQPEIIHCGECKHRDPEDHKCDCGHDIIWQLPRDEKWYCADAERKTDE